MSAEIGTYEMRLSELFISSEPLFWVLRVEQARELPGGRGHGYKLWVCTGRAVEQAARMADPTAWVFAGDYTLPLAVMKWVNTTVETFRTKYAIIKVSDSLDAVLRTVPDPAAITAQLGTVAIAKPIGESQVSDQAMSAGIREWMARWGK